MIEDAAAAEVSLDPIRARMLAELAEPHTATTLAARLGLARQKVNYHVKILEQHGLVELVEERRKGNMTERVVRASAAAYVISPAALAAVAPDPARSPDRLSARWLLALAARLVRETGALINGAARANKPLATFGLDAEVRFAKPADRAAFMGELTDAIAGLISKYQSETGRPHRLIVAVHPSITEDADPPAGGAAVMTHPFEVRSEFTVDATPDQVWAAITSGPGVDSWLMGRTEIDSDNKTSTFAMFGETSRASITAWEPGHRYATQEDKNPDGTFMAFEWLIESRDGGGAVVRVVHSGLLGEDWEAEYNGLSVGDHAYMTKLASTWSTSRRVPRRTRCSCPGRSPRTRGRR